MKNNIWKIIQLPLALVLSLLAIIEVPFINTNTFIKKGDKISYAYNFVFDLILSFILWLLIFGVLISVLFFISK